MYTKSITMRLKGHIVTVTGLVFLHCDLVEQVYNRMLAKGLTVDIDVLFNAVIAKG